MGLNAGRPLSSPQKEAGHLNPRVVKEPSQFSGAKRMQTAERIGRIEHKVASPTQQLSQGANRPGKAQGRQPPHLDGAALGDHLLVVAVGAFTGRAHGVELLPLLAAPLNGTD